MPISARQSGSVTILDLKGKLTIGIGDVQLREAVHNALSSGGTHILLNMSGVTQMDSSGMGELVSAYTNVSNKGGRLKLCNLPPKVQDLLQLTQLLTIFEAYDSETDGIEAFM